MLFCCALYFAATDFLSRLDRIMEKCLVARIPGCLPKEWRGTLSSFTPWSLPDKFRGDWVIKQKPLGMTTLASQTQSTAAKGREQGAAKASHALDFKKEEKVY
jgi:hypothetical protein